MTPEQRQQAIAQAFDAFQRSMREQYSGEIMAAIQQQQLIDANGGGTIIQSRAIVTVNLLPAPQNGAQAAPEPKRRKARKNNQSQEVDA